MCSRGRASKAHIDVVEEVEAAGHVLRYVLPLVEPGQLPRQVVRLVPVVHVQRLHDTELRLDGIG